MALSQIDSSAINLGSASGTGNVVLSASPVFTGNITTPIINSATTLSLQTGGTTAVTVDGSQNVGIGTVTMNNKLNITTGAGDGLRLTSTSGAIALVMAGTTENRIQGLGAVPVTLYSYNSEAMRIDSTGNIGIGTNAPQYKVHSYVTLGSNAGVGYPIVAESYSSAAGNNNGAGIGLVQGSRAQASIEGIRTNPAGDYGSALVFKTNNPSQASGLMTDLVERMRIDSAGNFKASYQGTMAPATWCRAHVQFNGGAGGTAGTIAGSFNVSSVSATGTGYYTVNFATAMPDANYSVATSGENGASYSGVIMPSGAYTYSTSYCSILTNAPGTGTATNSRATSLAIFR